MRWLCGILCLCLFWGCATQTPQIQDIQLTNPYSQALPQLTLNMNYTLQESQQERAKSYLENHFKIWDTPQEILHANAFDWIIQSSRNHPGLGENLLPNSTEWVEELIANAQLESYPNTFQKGIITNDSPLRLMPTLKPRFYSGEGEGYPFDQWQNSAIYSATPILITHTTRDKQWYFVKSSFAGGWILRENVAILSLKEQESLRKNHRLIIAFNDQTPIYDANDMFLQYSKVGKFFWLKSETQESYEILIPTTNTRNNLIWQTAKIDKHNFAPFPLEWNTHHIEKIAAALMDQKYGWGGALDNRDCSAMTRDFFGTFGIWLPRNSGAQAHIKSLGEYIALDQNQSLEEKEQQILKQALPWGSLLWFRGHVMIYVGELDGKAMVFHNIWGLRTLDPTLQGGHYNKGRYIIGQSLISDLHIGKDLPYIDKDKLLIQRVMGIKNLFLPQDIKEK